MASPLAEDTPPPVPEFTPLRIPTEILESIFLRLGSHADLARTCCASASFRRIILNPAFLRRHRALYPPLLLGVLCGRFQPAYGHPGTRAGIALYRAASFAFNNYLPPGRWSQWVCQDARDGRVLLMCGPDGPTQPFTFPDLAVCDPLSRRYRLLPLIPDRLVASAQLDLHVIRYLEVLLVPSGHAEEDETSFKVVARTHGSQKVAVFVFSSDSGRWSFGASITWEEINATGLSMPLLPVGSHPLKPAHYDHGCLYWKLEDRDNVLKLDLNHMVFSTVDLPRYHRGSDVAIFEAGEGRLAMFSHIPFLDSVNHYTAMQNRGNSWAIDDDWQFENVITLPRRCNFVGAREGYVFLLSYPLPQDGTVGVACYSVNVKTLKIERVHHFLNIMCDRTLPYFGFPPNMSPRRI